jgi:hypothetical protein
MGGSCRKYGTRQFGWRRGNNVVLKNATRTILDIKGLKD